MKWLYGSLLLAVVATIAFLTTSQMELDKIEAKLDRCEAKLAAIHVRVDEYEAALAEEAN